MPVGVQLLLVGLYLPPVLYLSAPDDHFTATPNRGMTASAVGGVGGAGSCPTVRAGIISAACACVAATYGSAPDNHFMAGPDCRVTRSTLGGIGHGGRCPTVRAGEVLPASLKGDSAIVTTPDDHRSAGPHCCVTIPSGPGHWLCW